MNPQTHFINSHVVNPRNPNEKSVAVQIMEAGHAERTHKARYPSSKRSSKKDSDTASVSSFGSSISLLKDKFRSSSSKKDETPRSTQKKVLRDQVNFVG